MLEKILDLFPDDTFIRIDGFNDAIIGFDQQEMKLIYSVEKIIDILIEDLGFTPDDAIDHFEYNIRRSIPYIDNAPILLDKPE